jgi:hypothetical protein
MSLWAVLSLLCGVAVLCPITSLLGPILGVVALAEIRRKPYRTGTGLAVAGILCGLVATAGWAAAARWWHVNARVPLLRGPAPALAAGLAGDLSGFKAGFTEEGAVADDAEALAFLDEVSGRYGHLVGSTQRQAGAEEAPPTPADTRRPRVAYTFQFESGPVEAEARFVVWAQGQGLVLKFAWLALRDQEEGDLVYPASAIDAVGYDPLSQPEPPQ